MDIALFRKLLQQQQLSPDDFENIERKQNGTISVYSDVTALLYTGILLLATGFGILIYKNIDSLGHTVITTTVATLCSGSFAYCVVYSTGYSNAKKSSPGLLFDYILLAACLLLLTLTGYLQFQYEIFGPHWGLATFIPMVLLFTAAYYFDHVGVLSMAVTNLAAWAGLTVAPLQFINDNNFHATRLIYTAIVLGAGLLAFSYLSKARNVKAHFSNTYDNFGTHILFISLLAALFTFTTVYLLFFVILVLATFFFCKNAVKNNSFYYLVVSLLYGYLAVCYVVCNVLWSMDANDASLFLTFIYFIGSGIALIRILLHFNRKLKKNGDLSY